MEQTPRRSSKTGKIVALILIVTMAVVGIFAALTYPRSIVNFSVSFTIGAQTEREDCEVPFFHSLVQVEVSVTSGSALWTARISRDDETVWNHTTVQGGQTTYTSDWTPLLAGHYNFTFATIGIGSLDADVSVASKGGFW